VAAVGASHGGNSRSVPRRIEPIVNRRANLSPADRRFAAPGMAGDEQDDPLLRSNRPLQPRVDGVPRAIEGHSMEVDDPVGADVARAQPPVPAGVQRGSRMFSRWRESGKCRPRRQLRKRRPCSGSGLFRPALFGGRFRCAFGGGFRVSRKWADGRGDPLPQRLFLSAERSHERRCRAEGARGPAPWRTFLRRSSLPHRPRPRTYRPGWRP